MQHHLPAVHSAVYLSHKTIFSTISAPLGHACQYTTRLTVQQTLSQKTHTILLPLEVFTSTSVHSDTLSHSQMSIDHLHLSVLRPPQHCQLFRQSDLQTNSELDSQYANTSTMRAKPRICKVCLLFLSILI